MPLLHTNNQRLKFIGCEIMYREACLLAAMTPHRVDVEFLRKGLHDLETPNMVARIQAAIDAVDPELKYAAILLGYARCNDGLVGIQARAVPLVIPRAHDCITLFFGSRVAYQGYFDQHPGTYYMTTGWAERNISENTARPAYGQQGVMGKLGLAKSWDQLVAEYGEENAKYIQEMTGDWMNQYDNSLFLKMGVGGEEPLVEQTRQEAARRNWRFELQDGNWSLLKKLFHGPWDDDFLIVPPGHRIVARNDADILAAEPVPPP
jgi:hypothetical protein